MAAWDRYTIGEKLWKIRVRFAMFSNFLTSKSTRAGHKCISCEYIKRVLVKPIIIAFTLVPMWNIFRDAGLPKAHWAPGKIIEKVILVGGSRAF